MKEKEIKIVPLNLKEVIGTRKYTLDVLLKNIANDALTNGSLDGLRFVKAILDMASNVDLPDARKFTKLALVLYSGLTPEQIAELQKKD